MARRVGSAACWLMGLLMSLLCGPAWAQGWEVMRLQVAGARAEVATVELRLAPGAAMQAHQLRVKDKLADGVELAAGVGVEVEVISPAGMRLLKRSASRASVILTSTVKGSESARVRQGQWRFARLAGGLSQKLDPFTAKAGETSAQTRTTEFTVAVDELRGLALYQVQEGAVLVTVPVRLAVAGVASDTKREQRQLLRAGDPELSLPLSPGGWLRHFGNYDEALTAFEKQVRDAQDRRDTDAQVDALMALGDMRVLAGRPLEAQAPFEQALALVPAPEDAYWRAVLHGRIGASLQMQNRFVEAAAAYRQSLALHEQLPRREGELTVEEQSTNIALNLAWAGTFRCADEWAQRLLRRLDELRAGPARHIRSALLATRGSAAYGLKRAGEARVLHRQALEIERTLAAIEQNKATAGLVSALNLVGSDETLLGNLTVAEALHREALARIQTLFSGPNPLKADTHLGLAELHRVRRQWSTALEEILRAEDILNALPADRLRLGSTWLQRAEVLRDSGRSPAAVQAYRKAREHWSEVWPEASHPFFHENLLPGLSRVLRSTGAPAAEIEEVDRAAKSGAQALRQQEAQCPR